MAKKLRWKPLKSKFNSSFAATVTFLFPDCCTETFKLPQIWQALAEHRQPVLKLLPVAESSVVSMACSRSASVWQSRLSYWPELLCLLPAQPVMSSNLHRAHMDTCKLMHEMSMCFHSTSDTTFRCLLLLLSKNNSRHLIRNIKHTQAHLHTAPNLHLVLINLTSSEWRVRVRWTLFMQKGKSWNCVIAPSYKHVLLVLNKGAFRFLKQDGLPASHLLSAAPLTSNRRPFSRGIYFSVWTALHGHCSVCTLPGLSSLVELSTRCHTADSTTHADAWGCM